MRNFSPRKLICLMIPIFGTVSIVGTGFSLWVFNDSGNKNHQEQSLKLEVTSECMVGAFVKDSLKTHGSVEEADKHFIFPSMLVFEEGHGLEQDLTKGLNFYKKTENLPESPYYDKNQPIYSGQPYFGDKVDIYFFKDEMLDNDSTFKLEASIRVTTHLCEAIAVLDQFQFSHQTTKKEILNSETGLIDLEFTYEFTKLCNVSTKTYKGNLLKPYVIQEKNILDNHNYWLYTYNFNLGEIFRYTSLDYKPISVAAYKNLLRIITNTNEKLQFTFKALVAE